MPHTHHAWVRRAERTERAQLTVNELAWLDFWRMITADRDPAPNLRLVQRVQLLVRRGWICSK